MNRLLLVAALAVAAPAARAADAPTDQERKAVVAKAYDFLKSKQADDGSFMGRRTGPGVTALAVAALVKSGYPVDDPVVAKGLAFIEKAVNKDGGIYSPQIPIQVYTTSLAVVTFKECNKDGKYDATIANAVKFLKGVQDAGGEDDKNPAFGGAGYSAKSRPDTSNTAFFLEALHAAGTGKDDPAFKKAIVFLSRSQNLPSETNTLPYAAKVADDDKGGFVYNLGDATNDKSTKKTPAGGLRSEGGMTYSGLKSFLYAGVGKDDPRVKAAVAWIKKHYSVTENPGQKDAGLFYYYHTFAKAMDALGEEVFEDAKGTKHAWKKELFEQLKSTQKADGSWVNSNGAFEESAPELATAFAVLSLGYTKGK
jgi:hypothetical protein